MQAKGFWNQGMVLRVVMVVFLSFLTFQAAYAATLFTKKEALRNVFHTRDEHGVDEVVTESKVLSDENRQVVLEALGGKFVNHTKGQKARELDKQREFIFYFGIKNDEKTGVALILEEPGKWGPIEFLVHMDMKGVVQEVMIMRYTEVRGRPIARRSFLKQFKGKSTKSAFKLNDDVVAISGATISSRAVAFTVKKAALIYQELL